MLKISSRAHPTLEQYWQPSRRALQSVLSNKSLGFLSLPERKNLAESSKNLARSLAGKFTDVVVVGVGGSSLGPKALYQVVRSNSTSAKLHFCDNVDPYEFNRLVADLRDLSQTLWIFISKSGGTIETLLTAEFVMQLYSEKSLSFQSNAVIISEQKNNQLTEWAKTLNLPQLEVPENVGGRYSVLSPVGMFPLEAVGISSDAFFAGASKALKDTELVSEMMAQFLQSFDREEWISFFWFYMSSLHGCGLWLEQLWAESLAKLVTRTGGPAPRVSTPVTAVGSSDQHSLLQQVMEGAKDKFVVFVGISSLVNVGAKLKQAQFKDLQFMQNRGMGDLLKAQSQGTAKALRENGISTIEIELEDYSPESLGYFLMFSEMLVAGLGEVLDIDAFNQPGVELGKRLARKILTS